MTYVKIIKKDSIISEIEIKGHALSGQYNQDIVCAGISSIVFGICNALEELSIYDENQIVFKEDMIKIPNILKQKDVQLICKTMIVQLQTIKRSYPKYIEILFQ
ncbi:ribosomal-processing cysteine protease Prp [Mycoplasmatota bacterium]|nr:ribosomal-processing cysteine protease Prp [Mycoplasmatota bacterium]